MMKKYALTYEDGNDDNDSVVSKEVEMIQSTKIQIQKQDPGRKNKNKQ